MEGLIVEAWHTYFWVDLFLVEALSGSWPPEAAVWARSWATCTETT